MIGFLFHSEDTTKRIAKAAEGAAFRNFSHAAARISKDAKASLVTAEGPSSPGTPPHTHRGAYLRRAVRFDANKEGAVIGPMHSIVGEAGAAHEFGEEFRGQDYPERSYMGPALERNVPRFAQDWVGSIGE
jgi:hypothetical protein